MNLLAFDLGKKYGVARLDNKGITHWHGVAANAWEFFQEADDLIFSCSPAAVLYENAAFQPGWASQDWQQWRVACEMACTKNDVKFYKVSVGTVKLHITGDGGFSKPKRKSDPEYKMFPALRARGFDAHTFDEADALALLLYAMDTGLVEVDK
jgi:hypothetical protein